ncbi:hypothetical protein BDZ91DRAFT_811426 [Kalaharituber pfeilii]|nr:hypothetical protein BDZ91DRAFT_811426 [Kalaharituber pfeilii]
MRPVQGLDLPQIPSSKNCWGVQPPPSQQQSTAGTHLSTIHRAIDGARDYINLVFCPISPLSMRLIVPRQPPMTPLLFSATSVGFSKSANFLSLRSTIRGVTPGSPIRPIQRPPHLIPSHSGAAAKEDTTGRLGWNTFTAPVLQNFRPANRGTTFADFGFGAGPLLTRRRAKKNLDWGFLVPPTPSACWDNPPFLFGMDSGDIWYLGVRPRGGSDARWFSPTRIILPLVPAGRPGTALCDVVPGSSVLAGEEKVPVETRIAGWDDARERESPFLGNATRGCATTLAWGIAPLFNLFVFPVHAAKNLPPPRPLYLHHHIYGIPPPALHLTVPFNLKRSILSSGEKQGI